MWASRGGTATFRSSSTRRSPSSPRVGRALPCSPFPISIRPSNSPTVPSIPKMIPRVNDWNRLVRQVAARHAKSVTLIDLNRMLDPNGHYAMTVDRVAMRWPDDGIHISTAGGEWLQPRLLPELGQLGLRVRLGGR